MGARDAHRRSHPTWGEPRPGTARRLVERVRAAMGSTPPVRPGGLRDLPLALRSGEMAQAYLVAEDASDHRRAAAAAVAAMDRAASAEAWWQADLWAHRALWHFEQAHLTLQATRQARRIGELRSAAGDPQSARRYYAEAIDEARDIGAEHEQGLATLGLGRSLMELGEVSGARRLGGAAVELLARAGAPAGEIEAARGLLGTERPVGEGTEDTS